MSSSEDSPQEGGEEVFKLDEDYFSAEHSSHITSSYYPEKLIMLACKKTEQPNRVLKLLRASLTNLTKQVSRSSGQSSFDTSRLERIVEIYDALNQGHINKLLLSKLVFPGLPLELKGLRGVIWRIFLNYLPLDTTRWDQIIKQRKQCYRSYCEELIANPSFDEEDPLTLNKNSKWQAYFAQQKTRTSIRDDIIRTRADTAFYTFQKIHKHKQQRRSAAAAESRPSDTGTSSPLSEEDAGGEATTTSPFQKSKSAAGTTEQEEKSHDQIARRKSMLKEGPVETHLEAIWRILFVFALLNPGIGYVQGMNEIVAVLYHAFYTDYEGSALESLELDIEADTFFCFHELMTELRDRFSKTHDGSKTGIVARVEHFWSAMKTLDYEIWLKFEHEGIKPHFFAIRWFLVLLAQELSLEQTAELWDVLLADPFRFDYLNYLGAAILKMKKEEIMKQDSGGCLYMFQNLGKLNISRLRKETNKLLQLKKKYRQFLLLC